MTVERWENPIRRRLRESRPVFGCTITSPSLDLAARAAAAGFDFLWLEMEHSPVSLETVRNVVLATRALPAVPFARVPVTETWVAKRALDAGAWGIVAPMVNTVEQARSIVAATKYPPIGNRSVGGGMHSLNFGCTSSEYYASANDQLLVILQTESPEGIANAEEIYGLPGVDARQREVPVLAQRGRQRGVHDGVRADGVAGAQLQRDLFRACSGRKDQAQEDRQVTRPDGAGHGKTPGANDQHGPRHSFPCSATHAWLR